MLRKRKARLYGLVPSPLRCAETLSRARARVEGALTPDLWSDPFVSSPSPTLPLRAGSLPPCGRGLKVACRVPESWERGAGEIDAG